MTDQNTYGGDQADTPILRPVSYSDYVAARREKSELRIEFPGATLTVDPGYCMADVYRSLQDTFCNLLAFEMTNFLEN